MSKEELDEVRAEVDAEFEAEERFLKKKKQHKLYKKNQSVEDDLGSLFGHSISGKLPKSANKITLKVLPFFIVVFTFPFFFCLMQ